jgi:hypothetical protein
LGADQSGETFGDSFQKGLCGVPFFGALDFVPADQDFIGVCAVIRTENVRVSADEFFADFVGNGIEIEPVLFFGDLRMENDLEQKVAEFFAEIGIVLKVDGVDDFVSFLQKTGSERFMGLFAVPRATVWSPEVCDDEAEPFERGQRRRRGGTHGALIPCGKIPGIAISERIGELGGITGCSRRGQRLEWLEAWRTKWREPEWAARTE